MRKILFILGLALACSNMHAQKILHPLSDDKLMHYGGFIGVNLPSYIVRPETVYSPTLGFGVTFGGYVDVKLSRYLNFRLCPNYNINFVSINTKSDTDIYRAKFMPISIPAYLKWSAERKGNYKPYLLAGGGFSVDAEAFKKEEKKNIFTKKMIYFAEIGLGCDYYTNWFRGAPEIKYQISLNNIVDPMNSAEGKIKNISKLHYHQISLIFNFGSL
jgi:hypothetical protein